MINIEKTLFVIVLWFIAIVNFIPAYNKNDLFLIIVSWFFLFLVALVTCFEIVGVFLNMNQKRTHNLAYEQNIKESVSDASKQIERSHAIRSIMSDNPEFDYDEAKESLEREEEHIRLLEEEE